jgi:hypothetical protein
MPPNSSKVNLRAARRSFTRRLWCDDRLPTDIVDAIWRGEIKRLLYGSTPLQVKDRCIVVRREHPSGPLLIKQHLWGNAWRTFRSVGREAAARRCARLGLELHRRGIPTPLPRVCLEQRFGPWVTSSYLITDYVEGTSLYRYIRFGLHPTDELRRVARQVACIWQQMVEAGISHNDMKPENFIVDEQGDVWLIDLEKARLNEEAKRQRVRCVFDVKNFLHVRGWHRRPEARQIFLDEFLKTPYGAWLDSVVSTTGPDPKLSVVVSIDRHPSVSSISRAIDSVRDIADDVLLVAATDHGGTEVVDRVVLCGEDAGAGADTRLNGERERNKWTLALGQNEIVTPFLAKEIQQRIADQAAHVAFQIPIEQQLFGRSVAPAKGDQHHSIRLFREKACSYSFVDGIPVVAAHPAQVGKLTGTIQRCVCAAVSEFVDRLNDKTTRAATRRRSAGERPALLRALLRAIGRALRQSFQRDGIGSGWAGLQRAFLDGTFIWVEETKLRQLWGEFFVETLSDDESDAGVSDSAIRLSSSDCDEDAVKRAA